MYSITDHSYCKLIGGDHPLEREVSTHVDSDASKDDTEHSCPEMNAHDPSVEGGSSVNVHSNSPKDTTDLSACETPVHHPCVEDPSSFHDNVDPPEDISEVTVRAFDNVKDRPSQDKDLLIESLKLEVERKERMLAQIFRPDQIEWLESRLTPGSGHDLYKWSSETLSNSLKIRIACGLNGYEYLRKGQTQNNSNGVFCGKIKTVHETHFSDATIIFKLNKIKALLPVLRFSRFHSTLCFYWSCTVRVRGCEMFTDHV
ncbi:UNVERIFIED_CONTAM: hypothetical protein FKN15_032161 [Acipenser sinensis]